MNKSTPDYRTLMAKALQEIKTLKKSIKRYETAEKEPIAIIGMSCRFPGGANDPNSYWSLLRDGRDAIDEVPEGRWDLEQFYDLDREAFGKMYTRNGGFINDVTGFDAGFFGISPREVESMDPHQRVLLEVCWETLEYANLLPSSLSGSNTGVFIGASSMDHIVNQIGEAGLEDVGPYSGSGCALSPIAGRVSYNFGFTGPSLVVDTACSSSLLSLHLAAESLRRKECEMALAGGTHFILHPGYSIAFCKANMLSEDGRCKTFDEKANGYVRGEGCGVVALKRLSDAERDGDTILALFRGSAVNQDGASGGLTVPNGPAQEQVIRKALEKADIDTKSVSYIEAHGTGTPLGDPVEIGALGNVFKQPIQVGSVKTNIGHLEASAGIAATMKVILSLQHQSIPAHLHFKNPNPLIPWSSSKIKVPTQLTPWTKQDNEPLIAGISAFGFSGTNVHVVMSDYSTTDEIEKKQSHTQNNKPNNQEQILVLSARHIDALRALASRWAEDSLANPDVDFDLLCAGAAHYRTEFKVRLAIVTNSAVQASELLLKFANNEQTKGISLAEVDDDLTNIAFLCTGQGSQYPGMGQELYRDEAVFRDAINECAELLRNNSDISLLDLLYPQSFNTVKSFNTIKSTNADNDLLNETANTQPALFSFEYALARLWQSWGIQPSALIGHSVGEYVAACLAGVFTLADALKLITARARLMQALPKKGAMVAVFATADQLEPLLINHTDSLSIAAYNGPRNTVVSGNSEAINLLLNDLDTQGIEYRRLAVSHAFHSPLMKPMLSDFRSVAESITYQNPQLPLISNVSGDFADTEIACADYWVQHVLAPVRFADGLQQLLDTNYHYLLEIGPTATLVGMAKQTVDEQVVLASSLNKNQSDRASMLAALGEYWVNGGVVNWSLLNMQPRRDIQLPMYPFQRREYASNIEIDAARGNMHGMTALEHPLLQRRFQSPLVEQTLFETVFSKRNQPFIEDHRVYDKLVIAGASHLSLVLSALKLADLSHNGAYSLTDIMFPMALIVPEQGECTVQLSIKPQAGELSKFRLISLSDSSGSSNISELKLHAKGMVSKLAIEEKIPDLDAIWARCTEILPANDIYEVQAKRHIIVGPSYHWLTQLHRGQSEVIARLQPPEILANVINNYSLHPGLIDSCFGAMVMAQPVDIDDSFIPFSLNALHFYPPKKGFSNISSLVAHAVVRQHDEVNQQNLMKLVGDIHLYTEEGELIAEFLGLEGRRASREALFSSDEIQTPELYQIDWEKIQAVTTSPVLSTDTSFLEKKESPQHYLIFSDAGEISEKLISTLKHKGIQVTIVLQDHDAKTLTENETGHYVLSPTSDSQFKQLLNTSSKVEHIVYLWGLSQSPEQFDELHSACAGALHLLQALGENQKNATTHRTRLLLVTQGGQKVLNEEHLGSPQQSLLWGLGNVTASEHREWETICLDLDINSTAEQCAANLLDSMLSKNIQSMNEENRLAWRSNSEYCARLSVYEAPNKKVPANFAKPNMTYLITGAQGAIGRELASWLIQQGARHLALIGRSTADDEFLDTLQIQGAQSHFYQANVTNITELSRVIEQIEQTQAPLGGVFHLAGILDDGLLESQNWSRWQKVLAPKVKGAWNLHQLTKNKSLDVFVSFSSMASLLGTAGQGSYAAANSFLDALAQQRRSNGLAGLSVNWGPWADVGMSAQLAQEHHTRMESLGIGQITIGHAFDRLAELISAEHSDNQGQVGVLAMDWQRYCQSDNSPFLNNLVVTKTDTSIREQLQKSSSEERSVILTQTIVKVVSEVLSLPNNEITPRERLFDLGIDSLTALDMKNRLQTILSCQLSSTLIFDYPTIESLTQYFLDEFFPVLATREMKQEEQIVVEDNPLQHRDDLDDMSEDEAESLLLAQLEQMEKQS